MPPEPIHAGNLFVKKSTKFFVLFFDRLVYFRSEENFDSGEEPRGTVALLDVESCEEAGTGKFILVVKGEQPVSLTLEVPEDDDAEQWIRLIQQATEKCIAAQQGNNDEEAYEEVVAKEQAQSEEVQEDAAAKRADRQAVDEAERVSVCEGKLTIQRRVDAERYFFLFPDYLVYYKTLESQQAGAEPHGWIRVGDIKQFREMPGGFTMTLELEDGASRSASFLSQSKEDLDRWIAGFRTLLAEDLKESFVVSSRDPDDDVGQRLAGIAEDDGPDQRPQDHAPVRVSIESMQAEPNAVGRTRSSILDVETSQGQPDVIGQIRSSVGDEQTSEVGPGDGEETDAYPREARGAEVARAKTIEASVIGSEPLQTIGEETYNEETNSSEPIETLGEETDACPLDASPAAADVIYRGPLLWAFVNKYVVLYETHADRFTSCEEYENGFLPNGTLEASAVQKLEVMPGEMVITLDTGPVVLRPPDGESLQPWVKAFSRLIASSAPRHADVVVARAPYTRKSIGRGEQSPASPVTPNLLKPDLMKTTSGHMRGVHETSSKDTSNDGGHRGHPKPDLMKSASGHMRGVHEASRSQQHETSASRASSAAPSVSRARSMEDFAAPRASSAAPERRRGSNGSRMSDASLDEGSLASSGIRFAQSMRQQQSPTGVCSSSSPVPRTMQYVPRRRCSPQPGSGPSSPNANRARGPSSPTASTTTGPASPNAKTKIVPWAKGYKQATAFVAVPEAAYRIPQHRQPMRQVRDGKHQAPHLHRDLPQGALHGDILEERPHGKGFQINNDSRAAGSLHSSIAPTTGIAYTSRPDEVVEKLPQRMGEDIFDAASVCSVYDKVTAVRSNHGYNGQAGSAAGGSLRSPFDPSATGSKKSGGVTAKITDSERSPGCPLGRMQGGSGTRVRWPQGAAAKITEIGV